MELRGPGPKGQNSENMEDAMRQKLNKLKEIMEKNKDLTRGKKSSQPMSGHNVAVVSALEERDVRWLVTIMNSLHFKEQVRNINFINISAIKEKKWEKQSAEYTFCIYVHREYDWTSDKTLAQWVTSLSVQGKKNLVVVIDNARISDNEETARIREKYPSIRTFARDVFLFTEFEKSLDHWKILYKSPEPYKDAGGHQADIPPQVVLGPKYKVGIFSRSADRDYSWLMDLLKTDDFRDHVLSVRSCFISNNGYQQMSEDLSHCTFGILYHTKKKGRVNITDVTDSLYDEELQYLSTILGKKNTVVIIDDLEDSGDKRKSQILLTQPTIATYASDLFLISHEDKTDNIGQPAKSKILNYFLQLSGRRLEYPPPISQYKYESHKPTYKYSRSENEQRGVVSSSSIERSPYSSSIPPEEQPYSFVGRPGSTSRRSIVGIFSRSEKWDYFWLEKLLTSEDFGYKDVKCCKISGNNEVLRTVACNVKFGVLYHSEKTRSICFTDDSLYHEELEQLSTKLGKRKMIVVIDDLNVIWGGMKQEILEKQPSLRSLVADIFLFTISEKETMDQSKYGSTMSQSTMDQISHMKKILS